MWIRVIIILLCLSVPLQVFGIDTLFLKKNDLQPYYYAQIKDSSNVVVSISGATIYCTLKNYSTGEIKINRQTTGVNITDPTNGKFEYRWQSGDTNTAGRYTIEFEVNPTSGGKYTVPAGENAFVQIKESLDNQ